jgi:hypothetical protein
VRLARLVMVLLAGGLALLVAAIALSCLPAYAAVERDRSAPPPSYRYTDHPSRVSTGRTVMLYIDGDFGETERQRIASAVRQWNYVLNGFVQFRTSLLPDSASSSTAAQIRRAGGWIVARVDSRHPITHQSEGRHALAVTTGGRGGFVYVISDRLGSRDLTGIVMHELGHVLGAGHDGAGLMAPVYDDASGHCIDHDAVAMVATAQHLPLAQLNWCMPAGYERRPAATSMR